MTEEKMNIFQKIMTARLEFMNSNPQKTGYNKFQNFKYFELMDIVPVATSICCKLGLYTHINICDGMAKMTVLNANNPAEYVEYILSAPTVKEDKFNNMLQDTGRAETYLRRYLYLLFLDITENDTVDSADQNTFKNPKPTKQKGKKLFKTADKVKSDEKPSSRIVAENIIKDMPNPNLLQAKMELAKICKEGDMNKKECDAILKELQILLNEEEVQI